LDYVIVRKEMNCVFCEELKNRAFAENELAFAVLCGYPVNEGHTLIVPKRCFANFFDSTHEEKIAILDLLDRAKQILDKKHEPSAYNIGVNCGEDAGQTVFHLHVHLIPRYKGDMDDPRGGVRGVIPSKQKY